MLIDWFTVVAQALNFLILVWLMKRFLYHPILDAIDSRESRIATELANAACKEANAQKDREEFQRKSDEIEQQRAALISQATNEAAAERQRLFEEARKAIDEFSAKRQETLRNEARNLNQEICRRAQREVFAITRKILKDLASTCLEQQVIAVFTQRIRGLEENVKEGLARAFQTSADPVLVRSACEISSEQRTSIQNTLNQTFSAEIPIRFETNPDLVCGIELTKNGQKLGWSIADYIVSLETTVGELLNKQAKAELSPVAKANA